MVDLLYGDCLELLPNLLDNSIDMLLVDLPYGTTACKWDSVLPLDKLWEQYNRVCKRDAAMVFTQQESFIHIIFLLFKPCDKTKIEIKSISLKYD